MAGKGPILDRWILGTFPEELTFNLKSGEFQAEGSGLESEKKLEFPELKEGPWDWSL